MPGPSAEEGDHSGRKATTPGGGPDDLGELWCDSTEFVNPLPSAVNPVKSAWLVGPGCVNALLARMTGPFQFPLPGNRLAIAFCLGGSSSLDCQTAVTIPDLFRTS